MHTVIVGAGPVGLFTAVALARRGHRVTLVDRDGGPDGNGGWDRRGVMQFHHPHAIRQPVMDVLDEDIPEVHPALLAAGAADTVVRAPDGTSFAAGMQCRRMLFETVLRATAAAEPGVTLRTGHADDVLRERGRATGLRIDGRDVAADLVLNAGGRAGRLGRDTRPPEEGSDCGVAYVSRHYELLPGADPGPRNVSFGLLTVLRGYLVALFMQDNRTFCTVISRLSDDRELAVLRFDDAYETACAAVPLLAEWVDPARSRPISGVLPGGGLRNSYRAQSPVALPGLIHAGDAVCTTNPTAGRGIATGIVQARALVRLLGEHSDARDATEAFDAFCTEQVRPWFDDHMASDADLIRQYRGEDIDPERPLTSTTIVAAAAADPSMMRVVGPYLTMDALPATLAEVEPQARAVYLSGWRPPAPEGPTRDELLDLIRPVVAAR